jgi:hypothetical protein
VVGCPFADLRNRWRPGRASRCGGAAVFGALSRNSALPGDGVTVSFSSPNTTVAITGCTARFNAAETVDCQQTGDHWAAQLSVPNNATAGTGSVRWMISYQRAAGSSGDALGVLSLTVLAPNPTPPPTPNPHSNPLGIWLIIGGLLAVVGIVLAFFLRSFLRRGRHTLHPPASQLVGAVAHAGPELQVTIRQSEPRRDRLIRFVSHRPAPVSEIEEVRR